MELCHVEKCCSCYFFLFWSKFHQDDLLFLFKKEPNFLLVVLSTLPLRYQQINYKEKFV